MNSTQTTQPEEIGNRGIETKVNDTFQNTKQVSPHQLMLQLLNNSAKNNS